MTLLKGYDCTPGGVRFLPTDGDFYAGYITEPNQHFVSYPQIRTRFPNKILFIYTLGGRILRKAYPEAHLLVLDYERGNPDPNPNGWLAQQITLGWRLDELGVYADSSTWQSLAVRAGAKRVVAHYDGIAEVPLGFHCKQYSDKGGGGAYDVNVALPSFLNISTPNPPPPPPPPEVTVASVSEYKTADNRIGWTLLTDEGRVFHIEQQHASGSGQDADVWRNQDGSPNWLEITPKGVRVVK